MTPYLFMIAEDQPQAKQAWTLNGMPKILRNYLQGRYCPIPECPLDAHTGRIWIALKCSKL